MIKYYIYDANESYNLENFKEIDEKEFLKSLLYNYQVAEEYGDELEKLPNIIAKFVKNQCEDVEINNFIYVKTSKKTLKEYMDLD